MSDQLNRCYYEGMSVSEAVKMLESSYGTKISDRVIKNAKAKILKQNNQIWV
jgi:transposase